MVREKTIEHRGTRYTLNLDDNYLAIVILLEKILRAIERLKT